MLLSMARVQIIGTKKRRPRTIQALHRLGVLQIIDWQEKTSQFEKYGMLDQEAALLRDNLALRLTHTQAVLSALPDLSPSLPVEYNDYSARSAAWVSDAAGDDLAVVEPEVQALAAQRAKLEEQFNVLPRYEVTLRRLAPLIPTLVDLDHYTMTAIWVERRYQAALETVTGQLEALTAGQCETISGEAEGDILVAVLVFPRQHAEAVAKLLGQQNLSQLRLPAEFSGQPLTRTLAEIRQQLTEIPLLIDATKAQQHQLAERWQARLLIWQALLRDHLAQLEVYARLGQSDYTFALEGWLPQGKVAQLQAALAEAVGDEVMVTVLSVSPAEQSTAPVAFDNPSFVKPFEPLVSILAIPRYGGIDPSPLMAVFMPIFYGMIVGDVGYGVILLGLMLYLRHRFKYRDTLRCLAEVLAIGAAWSIFFGFLFGEFFGTLGETVGIHPLWFDRGHDVERLFLLTIGIGAGHIVLGLCLGVVESIRRRNRHKLIEKAAMLLMLMALFLLVAIVADYLPDSFFTPVSALAVVALAILIYSMGNIGFFLAPLEVMETVGNILSYLRIAAIGLSSIYLAQVGNLLAGFVGNMLVGLIIALLFHTLNIALSAFSPTVQSLRLHYVEFFGKFYEGGGQPYRPFKRSAPLGR